MEAHSWGGAVKRVVIGVGTHNRQEMLAECMKSLQAQELFEEQKAVYAVSIAVIDNAGTLPDNFTRAHAGKFPVQLLREPVPGYSAPRNRAVEYALSQGAAMLAFLDDDEVADRHWLAHLLQTKEMFHADIVTGPVTSIILDARRQWMAGAQPFKGRVDYKTGKILKSAYTHNIVIDANVLRRHPVAFPPHFSDIGGEDFYFSARAAMEGSRIVWCNEAGVSEKVPPARTTLHWVMRRGQRVSLSWSRACRMLYGRKAYLMILLYGLWRTARAALFFVRGLFLFSRAELVTSIFYTAQALGTIAAGFDRPRRKTDL